MFIIKILLKWIVLSATVVLAAKVIPGIAVVSWSTALWVGLVLGLINTFIKPVLSILSIPINILTLGLFGFVLNAFLFWAAAYFVTGFTVASFMAALLGSILVSVVMWLAHFFVD